MHEGYNQIPDNSEVIDGGSLEVIPQEEAHGSPERKKVFNVLGSGEVMADSREEYGPFVLGYEVDINMKAVDGDMKEILKGMDPNDRHMIVQGFTPDNRIIVQLSDIDTYFAFSLDDLAKIDHNMSVEVEKSNGVVDPWID